MFMNPPDLNPVLKTTWKKTWMITDCKEMRLGLQPVPVFIKLQQIINNWDEINVPFKNKY